MIEDIARSEGRRSRCGGRPAERDGREEDGNDPDEDDADVAGEVEEEEEELVGDIELS